MKKLTLILSLFVLLGTLCMMTADSGPLAPAPFPKVGQSSPVIQSKFFVIDAMIQNGKVMVELPMDTPSGSIALVLGEEKAKAFTADKKALEAVSFKDEEIKRMSMPEANTRFNLGSLSRGVQSVSFTGLQEKEIFRMVVAQPKSPMALKVQVTPLAARTGETVVATARISDEKLAAQATVEAMLPGGNTFSLNDKGVDGDKIAGDGIFAGSFTAPRVNGFEGINIRFTARGTRHDGSPFLRNAINSVMVTNPIGKMIAQGIKKENDMLTVPMQAAQGSYKVVVIFGYDDTTLAFANTDFHQKGEAKEITLSLPPEAGAANRAIVRLLNKATLGLEDELEIQLVPTQAPPDFEALSAIKHELPASKRKVAEVMHEEHK